MFAFFSLQLKSSEVDHSIDLTLGNFNDAAPLFSASDTKQFIGITNYPTTPVATRQMPPLAYPQPKQSATFSNGVTSASGTGSNNITSRPYTNSNNNAINGNPTTNSGANSYQQKSSSTLALAPPPQSRASITPSFNNTFARPPDAKPLNGRSSYPTNTQSSKHEVSDFSLAFLEEIVLFAYRLFRSIVVRHIKTVPTIRSWELQKRLTAECLFISSLPVLCDPISVSQFIYDFEFDADDQA